MQYFRLFSGCSNLYAGRRTGLEYVLQVFQERELFCDFREQSTVSAACNGSHPDATLEHHYSHATRNADLLSFSFLD